MKVTDSIVTQSLLIHKRQVKAPAVLALCLPSACRQALHVNNCIVQQVATPDQSTAPK